MSKVRALIIAVIILVLLNVVLVAFFIFHAPPPPPMREGPKRIVIERLHFDPAQVDAYEKAIATHQEKIRAKGQEAMRLRNELYAKLQEPDSAGADSIAIAIGAVQAQIEMIHFEHFKAIEALCKPEQKADFVALSHDLARLFRRPPPDRRRP